MPDLPPPRLYQTDVHRAELRDSIRTELARALRQRGLELVLRRADGLEERVSARSTRVEEPVAAMALAVLVTAPVGVEVDSVVAGTARDTLLATFWWEPGALVVQQAHRAAPLLTAGPSEDELRAGYGARLEQADREWDPLARGVVEQALAALSPAEREVIATVPLVRVREAVQRRDVAAGYFPAGADDARIELYDPAVRETASFVGSLTDPHPAAAHTLVHEIGHAFARDPARMAWLLERELVDASARDAAEAVALAGAPASPERDARLSQLQSRGPARRATFDALRAWDGDGEVLRAWTEAVGDELAPTTYGRTTADEGFAEAFALWHLDREALVRVSPRSAAF
ncbi:MAG: hypothetical protein ABMA64_19770, partial [Myxococcota bacterium]